MKKKLITLFVVILLTGWCATAQTVFENNDLKISKLEDKLWVVETTDNTTMYIVEGDKKAMLIDTGTKCEKLNEVVRQITQKPLVVVITHIHSDHAGNMSQFEEVYFHATDTVLLSTCPPYQGKVHYVTDGQKFDLGGKVLEISHMPAHTPGSIVILDRKAGNCFSGDAFGSGQVWLQLRPYSPMKTYIASCKKMENLMDQGITKVYCGHYPYVKKAYDKNYITQMRTLAEALVNGTAPAVTPHPAKVSIGSPNPMMVTLGDATIVFDQDHIN